MAWKAYHRAPYEKPKPKPPKFPGLSGPPIVTEDMVQQFNRNTLLYGLGIDLTKSKKDT